MFISVNSRAAASYKRVAADTSVQGADPHQLVTLLFDALVQSLQRAIGSLASGDISAKGAAIGKAVRILEEGLKPGLNTEQGGELALNLKSTYDYSIMRLTHANLRNDKAALAEVSALIEPVAEAWKQIKGPRPAYLQPVPGPGA